MQRTLFAEFLTEFIASISFLPDDERLH